jgi:phosphopantetheinyl transferase (holo-ACP synthase)
VTRTGPSPALALPVVGNDVVDLDQPRCAGKANDTRFVERVFTASERDRIREAPDPDHALWRCWAAKEASYKVVTKLLGSPPVFAHAAFAVDIDPDGASGTVTYREFTVPFTLHEASDHIHTIAVHSGGCSRDYRVVAGMEVADVDGFLPLDTLRGRFTPAERVFIHGVPSALARIAARRDMAAALAVAQDDILILAKDGPPGRVPPVVRVDGDLGRVDLSLSHDGRYVAWAFLFGLGSGAF